MIITNKQIADAFRAAKDYLNTIAADTPDTSEFICIALLIARQKGKIYHEQQNAARNIITERLGDVPYATWVGDHSEKLRDEITHDYDFNDGVKTQAARHAWLDMLIEEFSK